MQESREIIHYGLIPTSLLDWGENFMPFSKSRRKQTHFCIDIGIVICASIQVHRTFTHFRVRRCQWALSQCSQGFHGWVSMQNAAWDMSRAHFSGQALQDARCPSASLLHGYSWRIVNGTYDGSNHYENLTLQVRFNPRSHCITCWPMLANIAENLPHALN